MIKKTITLISLILLSSCALQYEYKMMDEMFKQAPSKTFKEKDFTVYVIGTREKVEGFLLKIPATKGIFYLKISAKIILEKSYFVYKKDKKHVRLPIFHRDWNKPLSTLNDRQAVGTQCMKFQKKYGAALKNN